MQILLLCVGGGCVLYMAPVYVILSNTPSYCERMRVKEEWDPESSQRKAKGGERVVTVFKSVKSERSDSGGVEEGREEGRYAVERRAGVGRACQRVLIMWCVKRVGG